MKKPYTKAQKRALAKYFGFDYELSDEEARVLANTFGGAQVLLSLAVGVFIENVKYEIKKVFKR